MARSGHEGAVWQKSAGRPGTADEIADAAELVMNERAGFITGSTFLIDGGATASYHYGALQEK